MKKLIILLILIVIPLIAFSQELGIDYSFNKYKQLSEGQLKSRLFWNNTGTVGSLVLGAGGAFAICVGGYYGVSAGILAAGLILSGPAQDLFQVLVRTVLVGGSAAGFGVALLGYAAIRFSIDTIGDLSVNKRMIKIELKQFQPVSYKDSPGIGIGINFAL